MLENAARLRALLSYNSATGVFTWRVDRGGKARAGTRAGSVGPSGYVLIGIDGEKYYGQRLAWLYVTGVWPAVKIDHRSTNRSDNSWLNLREADDFQNAQNAKGKRSSGKHKGVYWDAQTGKWRAQVVAKGVTISLGRFSDLDEARSAYNKAAEQHHGDFVRASI